MMTFVILVLNKTRPLTSTVLCDVCLKCCWARMPANVLFWAQSSPMDRCQAPWRPCCSAATALNLAVQWAIVSITTQAWSLCIARRIHVWLHISFAHQVYPAWLDLTLQAALYINTCGIVCFFSILCAGSPRAHSTLSHDKDSTNGRIHNMLPLKAMLSMKRSKSFAESQLGSVMSSPRHKAGTHSPLFRQGAVHILIWTLGSWDVQMLLIPHVLFYIKHHAHLVGDPEY